MQDPIILFGALRSGTTVFRLMLAGHPALHCPGENDYLFDFIRVLGDGNWVVDREALRQNHLGLDPDLTLNLDLPGRAFVADLLSQLQARAEGRLVLTLHRHIDLAQQIFPQSPIIHLLRDPRDVAKSSLRLGFAGNEYYGVDHWIQTEKAWDRVALEIPQDRIAELRYEELIRAPEVELSRIAEFISLPYDSGLLGYSETSGYKQPDVKLIEQWRRRQGPKMTALIEGKLGNLLTDKGYQLSGIPPHHPGPAQKWILKQDSRLRRFLFRVQRYGVLDPLLLALSSRIGLSYLRRWASDRMTNRDRELAREHGRKKDVFPASAGARNSPAESNQPGSSPQRSSETPL